MSHEPTDDDLFRSGIFIGATLGVLGTLAVCAVIAVVVTWAL